MTRHDFQQLVGSRIVLLDGATGTELVKRGMPSGVCPEQWCCDHPDAVVDIQRAYAAAGSDIVYVPSFGGNRLKLAEFGLAAEAVALNRRLAEISRRALPDGLIFGDLAPTGCFIQPTGDFDFEEAVAVYAEQVAGLLAGGVDGFAIETMMDLQEARAALLAVRAQCDLPVLATLTFETSGRSLTGTDPVAALVTLQSLGADAFGCNCSTGPEAMAALLARLRPYARIPLIAKPNAGVPRLVDGRTLFSMDAAAFAAWSPRLVAAGAGIVGGCCGTTPEHIGAVAAAVRPLAVPMPGALPGGVVASSRMVRRIGAGHAFTVIGERINPTGKKALQAELRAGSTALVRRYALEQTAAGAALLDVNVGVSGIDEPAMMTRCVAEIVRAGDLPLCIDSTDPEVVEAALRLYPGRALLNSISAERERLEKVLPIAARYGAMLILLPLTDAGIPATLAERIATVETIYQAARRYGYTKDDLCVDALVMTISANPEAAALTLDLIEWCQRDFGCATVCGLSNVSFGMPARPLLNQAFLGMALGRGLTAAIANPLADELMQLSVASDVLTGRDARFAHFLARFGGEAGGGGGGLPAPALVLTPEQRVYEGILRGDGDGIGAALDAALAAGTPPARLVDEQLISAITAVGDKFERKEYFLPQLIAAAEAMRCAMRQLEPLLAAGRAAATQTAAMPIILATVKGDIHDIGKNIVAILLRNYGFEVIDLGKDVAAETILDAAQRHRAKVIGLSALMTTTMIQMPLVMAAARARGMDDVRFLVGGAVVDAEFARSIGAEYAPDALAAVRLAQRWAAE